MILKSFYRKLSTKIYFIILLVAILLICLLSLIINYLDVTKVEGFSKRTFMYVDADLDKLKKDNDLVHVRHAMLVSYDDNILDDSRLKYPQFNDNTLVIVDDGEYSLNGNEVIINYPRIVNDTDYINKETFISVNDEKIILKIKNIIHNGGMNYFIISNDLYKDLSKQENFNHCIANIKNENVINNVSNKYKNATIVLSESTEEMEQRIKLEEYIKFLKMASYGVILVFIIIIVIINKNIKADLTISRMLEYKLGFTDMEVKLNFFKRIFSLHVLVFILVFMMILSIIVIGNSVMKLTLLYSNLWLVLILFGIILISDILLAIFYK